MYQRFQDLSSDQLMFLLVAYCLLTVIRIFPPDLAMLQTLAKVPLDLFPNDFEAMKLMNLHRSKSPVRSITSFFLQRPEPRSCFSIVESSASPVVGFASPG